MMNWLPPPEIAAAKVEVAEEIVVVAAPLELIATSPPLTVSLVFGAALPIPTLPPIKYDDPLDLMALDIFEASYKNKLPVPSPSS